jgi:hypothetical protein
MNTRLSRRAVACKHWDWGFYLNPLSDSPTALPDLDTPQALGWLMHLVRKAWEEPGLYCVCHKGKWLVEWPDLEGDLDLDYAHTEAEALVRALEAAP